MRSPAHARAQTPLQLKQRLVKTSEAPSPGREREWGLRPHAQTAHPGTIAVPLQRAAACWPPPCRANGRGESSAWKTASGRKPSFQKVAACVPGRAKVEQLK